MKKNLFPLFLFLILFSGVTNAYNIMDQKNINGGAFTWEEIVQERPASLSASDGPEGFIIMDRNLGATSNDIYNKSSYGYHYQWGNNYGFTIGCFEGGEEDIVGCSDATTSSATYLRAEWKDEYFHNGYDGRKFIKMDFKSTSEKRNSQRDYWENDEHHYGLWGGENDYSHFGEGDLGLNLTEQSKKNRQGPCPDGWHVPSIGEWAKFTTYWAIDYQEKHKTKLDFSDEYIVYQIPDSEAADEFIKTFKIPMAGYRDEDTANIRYGMGDFWSSSPFGLSKIGDEDDYFAYAFSLHPSNSDVGGWISNSNGSPRARGSSVRCFKNEYKRSEKQGGTNTTTGSIGENKIQPDKKTNTVDWFDNGDQSQMLSNGFTREYNNAFKFSQLNGITTATSIQNANMEGALTRIAMAKMLSNYAINVLGKVPNFNKSCSFDDVSLDLNRRYDNGVTLACQLGIMGVGITSFNPQGSVTRAQFGSALSRMLYGLADGVPYYEPHLRKLASEGVMKNTDPQKIETRGNVMLMLMRSAISVDELNKLIDDTTKAAEEKANRKVKLITVEGPFKGYPEFDISYWSSLGSTVKCQDENGILFANNSGIDFVYLYEDEKGKHTCTFEECVDDKGNIEKLLSNEKVNYGGDVREARAFSCTQNGVYKYVSRSLGEYQSGETAGLFHNNYNDKIIYTDEKDNSYGYLGVVDLLSSATDIGDEYGSKLFQIEQEFNKDKEQYFKRIQWYLGDLSIAINKKDSTDATLYEAIVNGYNTNYDKVIDYADALLRVINRYLDQLKEIQKTIKYESGEYTTSTKLTKMVAYLEAFKKAINEGEKRLDTIEKYMAKVSVRNGKYTFPSGWRDDITLEGHNLIAYARDFKETFNTYQKYLINYAKNYISKYVK